MKKMIKTIKSNDGAALSMVLVAFVVMLIFASTMLYLMSTNLKQAKHQEDYIKAYYLAYSGVEVGYASLVKDEEEMLNKFINGKTNKEEEKGIDFGDGKIDIIITSYEDKGNLWIKIASKGTLNKSKVSASTSMSFLAENKAQKKWAK